MYLYINIGVDEVGAILLSCYIVAFDDKMHGVFGVFVLALVGTSGDCITSIFLSIKSDPGNEFSELASYKFGSS